MNRQLKECLRSMLPRSVARRRILAGPLRGQALVTSWHDYPAAILGRTERPLLDWFEKNVKTGETWLDVGAHYGYTAIALARLVGTGGRVYAFEPVVASAGCISQAGSLNGLRQLTVVPVALGDCGELSVDRLPAVRGMVDTTAAGGSDEEPFLVASLDWLWPRIGGGKIDGVKIDVQGMEIEVLRGMAGILRESRPKLAIELHRGVPRGDFLAVLARMGYSAPGSPIEPLAGESAPRYADDRSYAFVAEAAGVETSLDAARRSACAT
jgi:FkbM family methyltransferase